MKKGSHLTSHCGKDHDIKAFLTGTNYNNLAQVLIENS